MRTTTRILSAATLIGAAVLLGAPAADATPVPAPPPASGEHAPPAAAAIGVHGDTSDFTFDSFDASYVLGRDRDKLSTLKVTETLVAEFPDFDQNHGIVRDIPSSYDGHPVHVDVQSITDGSGTRRDYQTSSISNGDGSFLELKIGAPGGIDEYVHGTQTFQIVYTSRNVTKYFADSKDDEFYWDTNGTGWDQPFASVSAKVALANGLASHLNGKTACYQGAQGSNTPCDISGTGSAGFTAAAQNLGPGQNMTVVLGFARGTFATPPFSIFDYVPLGVFIGVGALLASLVLALIFRFVVWRPRSGDIIIAQYEPPAGVSAMLAANIVGQTKRGMAATMVDLAVRKKIRLLERKGEGLFGGEAYGVQQLDAGGLLPDEQQVMGALFGTAGFIGGAALPPGIQLEGAPAAGVPAQVGAVKWLQKQDTVLGQAVRAITKQVDAETRTTGLRRGRPHGILALCLLLGIAGLIAFLSATVFGADAGTTWGVLGLVVGIWILITAVGLVASIKPLTKTGSQLWDQLEGLKLYIRLAEADRLRMLQSVTGAERIDTTDGTQIVKIYERLLPYAVLFGLENQWAGELAKYYGNTPPDWYDGNIGTFSAIGFASAIGSFSSTAASSLSGSASSSSSGGSGGGGFSGGGGGGGGGGGF